MRISSSQPRDSQIVRHNPMQSHGLAPFASHHQRLTCRWPSNRRDRCSEFIALQPACKSTGAWTQAKHNKISTEQRCKVPAARFLTFPEPCAISANIHEKPKIQKSVRAPHLMLPNKSTSQKTLFSLVVLGRWRQKTARFRTAGQWKLFIIIGTSG